MVAELGDTLKAGNRIHLTRRTALNLGAIAIAAPLGRRALAASQVPLTATISLNGQNYVYREDTGYDLGDFVSDIGGFIQGCVRSTVAGSPLTVFFRPDRSSDRAEVVFELGQLFGGTAANLGAYAVTIARGSETLATVSVPRHYWFSRWRWQSSPRPIVSDVTQLIAQNLLPPYQRTSSNSIAGGSNSGGGGATGSVSPPPAPPTSHVPSQLELVMSAIASGRFGNVDVLSVLTLLMEEAKSSAPRPVADVVTPSAAAAVVSAAEITATIPYTIMGLAGVTPYMPTGGERDDIGLLTECQAKYVCTGDAQALATLRAQAEAAGTMPWHMRDENTNAPINFTAYPTATWYANKPYWIYIPVTDTPITIDSAHQPPLAYLPYILTGDPYHLEDLQFQTNWNWGTLPPGYRPSIPQARSFAWSLRSMAQSAKVTPKTVPSWLLPQSYWLSMLETYRNHVNLYINDPLPPYSLFRSTADATGGRGDPVSGLPEGTWIDPWQEEFMLAVVGWTISLGFTTWENFFNWKAGSTLARTSTTSGWPRAQSTPYRLLVRESKTAPYVTSWAEAWAITHRIIGYTYQDPDVWVDGEMTYLEYTRAALVYIDKLLAADVSERLAWATRQFTSNPKWKFSYKWRIGTGL